MSSTFETDPHVTAVERLPRPGAVQLRHTAWLPTLDGEQFEGNFLWYGFRTREEALAEAIKHVKHRAGLAMEVRIDSRSGCLVSGDRPIIAETVTEARQLIVARAKGMVGGQQGDPAKQPYVRFRTAPDRSAWESLLECETYRHYDPADPDAGMSCCYLLYEEGNLSGVGGVIWTHVVAIGLTAPPEVWDHPADKPIGVDSLHDPDDDVGIDTDPDAN